MRDCVVSSERLFQSASFLQAKDSYLIVTGNEAEKNPATLYLWHSCVVRKMFSLWLMISSDSGMQKQNSVRFEEWRTRIWNRRWSNMCNRSTRSVGPGIVKGGGGSRDRGWRRQERGGGGVQNRNKLLLPFLNASFTPLTLHSLFL